MAARRVIIARRAVDDLEGIWHYIAGRAGPNTASDVIDKILKAIDLLAEMPGVGHTRTDLSRRYRVWSVFKFLIIYRHDSRALYVNRVVHGSRDIRRIVNE